MDASQTFLDALVESLTNAGDYNSLEQIAPTAVLWPDAEREWESLLPLLRQRMPLLTVGAYGSASATGPAAWVRCVAAHTLDADGATNGRIPVVYLPGVSGKQFAHIEQLPRELALLVELRFRCNVWAHPDGADWTPLDYLRGQQHGLNVETLTDAATRHALRQALPMVAGITVAQLRADAPWKAKDFDTLRKREVTAKELIARGESAQVEFKSTARWDVKNNCKSAEMEMVIVKTVAAFLNSHGGGILFIGVRDDGAVLGLGDDYQVWSKPEERDRDSYELWLMGMLTIKLGKQFAPYIKVAFPDVDGIEICQVTVAPGPEPAYFMEPNKKSGAPEERFYIRMGNQSLPLQTMSEAVKYSKQRWK